MRYQVADGNSMQTGQPRSAGTDLSCPDCSSTRLCRVGSIPDAFEFAGRMLDSPLAGGSLYRCNNCSLLWRHPQPDKTKLDALYRQGNADSWQDNPEKRLDWQIGAAHIRKMKSAASVLDVGCFDGRFLEYLGQPYLRAGIEVHPIAAKHAAEKGIQIVGHDFSALDTLTVPFDVVVALDVIEHVDNPRELLASLVNATRPGGLVIVSTGNTAAWPWRLMGGMYWYCSIAEHLAFINPDWCTRTAAKMGLEIEQISTFSHEPTKILGSAIQASANIFYHYLPDLAYKIRCLDARLKGKARRPSFKTPPHWRSAKDHFLVAFRVPNSSHQASLSG